MFEWIDGEHDHSEQGRSQADPTAQLQGIAKKIWFNIIYIQLNDN